MYWRISTSTEPGGGKKSGENDQGAGIALIGVALVVMIINLFLRLGVSSTRDREREEAAREHFDRTGRWPDEG